MTNNIIIMNSTEQGKDLPRFTKDFIGKGHELEQKKRQRRKAQLQQRSLANRVIFLEKEQVKTQKALQQKRQQLQRIMSIAQRQNQERQQKERLLLEREKNLSKAREQNRLRKMMHKQNKQQNMKLTMERNSLDYKITKRLIEQSEKRKQLNKLEDLTFRRERYMTLNLMKEKGRSRVDKYFQKKNKEHTRLYQQKIKSQEGNTRQKIDTIKKLGQIQDILRKKLEQSSMRVSQMQQIIGDVNNSVKKRSLSKTSFNKSLHQSPSMIASVEEDLLLQKDSNDQMVEQGAEGGVGVEGKVRKRRRNKHANRYKQYELF